MIVFSIWPCLSLPPNFQLANISKSWFLSLISTAAISSIAFSDFFSFLRSCFTIHKYCFTHIIEAALQRCSLEKVFWKYAANLEKNTNFTEIALRHGCSPVKLLHIFRTPFYKNISGGLLLISPIYTYFYKQLVLDPSPQNCLCFQDFQGSKFLNDSSVLWSNKQSLSVFRWFVSIRHWHSVSQRSKHFLWN